MYACMHVISQAIELVKKVTVFYCLPIFGMSALMALAAARAGELIPGVDDPEAALGGVIKESNLQEFVDMVSSPCVEDCTALLVKALNCVTDTDILLGLGSSGPGPGPRPPMFSRETIDAISGRCTKGARSPETLAMLNEQVLSVSHFNPTRGIAQQGSTG